MGDIETCFCGKVFLTTPFIGPNKSLDYYL